MSGGVQDQRDFILLSGKQTRRRITRRHDSRENVQNIYDYFIFSYTTIPQWLHRYTPPYIYIKVLQNGIVDLKKDKSDKNISIAIDILSTLITQNVWRQHKKAEWYAEKALILDRLMSKPEEVVIFYIIYVF